MLNIGTQLFGLAMQRINDCAGTYRALSEIGFSSIEPLIVPIRIPGMPLLWAQKDIKRELALVAEQGLEVTSCHVPLQSFGPIPSRLKSADMIRISGQSNIRYFITSGMIKDRKGAQKWSKIINPLIEPLAREGITLVYHNHDVELLPIGDGTTCALDELFDLCDPRLALQLDIGWAAYSGKDERAVLDQYRNRVVSIHLKDFFAEGLAFSRQRDDLRPEHFAPVGDGKVRTAEILQNLQGCPLMPNAIVVDQDKSIEPMLVALAKSFANLKLMNGAAP